ncbi:MAG: hypothetical protein F4089_06435 [Gammaproteobacteria bacterium]|nr:hypothetical protein [Gammaproteobacteria bacterium]MYJ74749.1 hypothetical protein [Gammaproteobacteria bacterium]
MPQMATVIARYQPPGKKITAMRDRGGYEDRPARVQVRVDGPDSWQTSSFWMTEPAGQHLRVGDTLEVR